MTERPGITVAELRDALGVGNTRGWQIVARLEVELVRREGERGLPWSLDGGSRIRTCEG